MPFETKTNARHHGKKLGLRIGLLCTLLLLGLTNGCKSSGERLEASASAKLTNGMDRDAVLHVYGKPYKSLRGPEGKSLDIFRSFERDPRFIPREAGYSGPTTYRILTVLYDSGGKVTKHLYSSGNVIWNGRSYGSAPEGVIVHELDPKRIKKGETSVKQLVDWFYEPSGTGFNLEDETQHHWIFIRSAYFTGVQGNELVVDVSPDGLVKDFIIYDDWKDNR
jgi:hypothetical protein